MDLGSLTRHLQPNMAAGRTGGDFAVVTIIITTTTAAGTGMEGCGSHEVPKTAVVTQPRSLLLLPPAAALIEPGNI